jgi:hypothetical protein
MSGGLAWQGKWGTERGGYLPGDVVSHEGATYVCASTMPSGSISGSISFSSASGSPTLNGNWQPLATPAPAPPVPRAGGFSIKKVFATSADLYAPLAGSDMHVGEFAIVQDTSALYLWEGRRFTFCTKLGGEVRGVVGPQGDSGAVGPTGPQGPVGDSGYGWAAAPVRFAPAPAPAPVQAPAAAAAPPACKFPPAFAETPLVDGDEASPACQICLAHKVSACIVDCGHANYCVSCLRQHGPATCPSCTKPMTHVVRFFQ